MVKIEDRNTPRKTCFLAIIFSPKVPQCLTWNWTWVSVRDWRITTSAVVRSPWEFFSIAERKSAITKIPTGPKEKKENYIESWQKERKSNWGGEREVWSRIRKA